MGPREVPFLWPLVPYVSRFFRGAYGTGGFFVVISQANSYLRAYLNTMVSREAQSIVCVNHCGVGGCSSKVERLPVEQDAAGALPVSHPKGYI